MNSSNGQKTEVRTPAGYHTITPYLIVDGAAELIEFLKQVFEAEQKDFFPMPDGKVGHAALQIGNSMLMLSDARDEWKPQSTMLYVYVKDVDETYRQALAAGAKSIKEPVDQFYGDRSAGVEDKWGNHWGIATHVEEVSDEELQKRMASMECAN